VNLRREGFRLEGKNKPPKIVFEKKQWRNANSAMDSLFVLFPDNYPILQAETSQTWTFELEWPRQLLEHVDSKLTEMADKCFQLKLSEIAYYVESWRAGEADFVFSMFHSRALIAPSLLNQRSGRYIEYAVHVDAHHDLSPSLMTATGPAILRNEAFGQTCKLNDPETINHAIDCGFLNKGNFLTGYVLASEPAKLFHVCDGISQNEFWLDPVVTTSEVGEKSVSVGSLNFSNKPVSNRWHIIETPTLPMTLPLEKNRGVWLDVDLDAFCNRFDGDSDRSSDPPDDLERQSLVLKIDKFLADLRGASWLRGVEVVSMAASPGFFPSEYWELTIPKLRNGITRLLEES
jgi:hypothetical protein